MHLLQGPLRPGGLEHEGAPGIGDQIAVVVGEGGRSWPQPPPGRGARAARPSPRRASRRCAPARARAAAGPSRSGRARTAPSVKTASLPIVTPCSLVPISAPHIQNGRLIRVAYVSATWGISIHVQRSRRTPPWVAARVPLEQLRLVRVTIGVLREQHAVGGDDDDRVTHRGLRAAPARARSV